MMSLCKLGLVAVVGLEVRRKSALNDTRHLVEVLSGVLIGKMRMEEGRDKKMREVGVLITGSRDDDKRASSLWEMLVYKEKLAD